MERPGLLLPSVSAEFSEKLPLSESIASLTLLLLVVLLLLLLEEVVVLVEVTNVLNKFEKSSTGSSWKIFSYSHIIHSTKKINIYTIIIIQK